MTFRIILPAALVATLGLAQAAQAQIIWNDSTAAPVMERSTQTPANSFEQPGGSKGPRASNGLHQNMDFDGGRLLQKSDVKKLQTALKSRGFYKGSIDGIWGGQTSQAILDYQSVNELPLTGTVNFGTLEDLGVNIDETKYR